MNKTPQGTILKFQLQEAFIAIPKKAFVCHVAFQYGKPTVWAIVPPEAEGSSEYKRVVFIVTGFERTPVNGRFIGTLVSNDGNFVLHAFEIGGE